MKTIGIHNFGATCYLNAILQSLYHCSVFNQIITIMGDNSKRPYLYSLRCIKDGLESNGNALSDKRYFKFLVLLLGYGRQHDSDEFFTLLIDKIHNETSKKLDNIPINKNSSKLSKYLDKKWFEQHKNDFSIFTTLFHGQLFDKLSCKCGKIIHRFSTFLTLKVDIPTIENCSIYNCIEHLFKQEIINETEKEWKCDEGCQQYQKTTKEHLIARTPEILVITFNRYQPDGRKIDTNVRFPLYLKLSKLDKLDNNERICDYELRSIVYHIGNSIYSGHYQTACRDLEDNEWYFVDDECVSKIHKPVITNAYMLFYEKIKVK